MTTDVDTVKCPAATHVPAIQYPKFRWAVLATACLAVIAFQVSVMSYGPLLGEIAKNLGVSLAQAVNLMTVFMLFAALSFFVAGPLCDRYGVPTVMVTSAFLSAVPTAATFWLGYSYAAVAVIRALQGCAVGFALAGMAPLVLRWFPPHQRGLALGIPGACNPLGAILGVLASPALFRSSGNWQHTVALLSGFGWFALVYCLVVFQVAKSCAPKVTVTLDKSSIAAVFRAAMRSPFTWVGVVATFAVNWIMQSAFSLSPSYFAEPKPVGLGMGPLAAGQLMGVVQLGAIVGPIVGGLLLDKLFGGKARGVLSIAFLLSLTYCAIQFGSIYNSRPLFLLFLVLSGAGIGMLFPLIQSQINELYDHHIVGRMNGVWLGFGAFGGSAGLFVNSIALKHTGNYIMPINIISAAAAVGLLLCAIRPAKPQGS
ncbi:MAG: MFS transporter [Candidatus Korobacteraceae bacterium]|jgi:MFS family permease